FELILLVIGSGKLLRSCNWWSFVCTTSSLIHHDKLSIDECRIRNSAPQGDTIVILKIPITFFALQKRHARPMSSLHGTLDSGGFFIFAIFIGMHTYAMR